MSEAKMWGPEPEVREVEAHHDRYGGGDCYAPWLVREAAMEVFGAVVRPASVLGVVWLAVNYTNTPNESVSMICDSGLDLVEGRVYEFCALSHDGTPMPRVEASGG